MKLTNVDQIDNLELYVKTMVSELLNKTFKQEREYYLCNNGSDKGNGYLPLAISNMV